MAIYHFTAKIISRSKGRSAVASAAYRAGEKLHNEYDGITHDYTKKSGIVHSEIMLPQNAPNEYSDRSILWNAVEKIEKAHNAQTAREVELALPVEFTKDEQIKLLREYIKTNFVDKGMCADICIHDKNNGNPHAHIMLTTRPINQDGTWGAKSKKIYMFDDNGEKIYDKKKKTYKCSTEKTTDWDNEETLVEWRKEWAESCNSFFLEKGIDERIDYRSFEERNLELVPTTHLGSEAHNLEKKGIKTQKGDYNRKVKELNEKMVVTIEELQALKDEKQKLELQEKSETSPANSENIRELYVIYQQGLNQRVRGFKTNARDYAAQKIRAEIKSISSQLIFLDVKKITTGDELRQKMTELESTASAIEKTLKEIGAKYNSGKKIIDSLNNLEKLKTRSDLTVPEKQLVKIFEKNIAKLNLQTSDEITEFKKEFKGLESARNDIQTSFNKTRAEMNICKAIIKNVEKIKSNKSTIEIQEKRDKPKVQ